MNTNKKTAEIEDVKINVKIKLSSLWVTVMLCHAYGDILSIMKPGAIEDFLIGKGAGGLPLTQVSLLLIAISMVLPIIMVFLSLTLKPKVNRWANIILGIVYTFVVPLSMLVETSAYSIFLGIVEVVLTALIVWYAWKWPKQEV